LCRSRCSFVSPAKASDELHALRLGATPANAITPGEFLEAPLWRLWENGHPPFADLEHDCVAATNTERLANRGRQGDLPFGGDLCLTPYYHVRIIAHLRTLQQARIA